jgi:hypothetical protein
MDNHVTYFGSIFGPWNSAAAAVTNLVRQKGVECSNMRVGETAGQCVLLQDFFADVSTAKRFMNLFIELDDQRKL